MSYPRFPSQGLNLLCLPRANAPPFFLDTVLPPACAGPLATCSILASCLSLSVIPKDPPSFKSKLKFLLLEGRRIFFRLFSPLQCIQAWQTTSVKGQLTNITGAAHHTPCALCCSLLIFSTLSSCGNHS